MRNDLFLNEMYLTDENLTDAELAILIALNGIMVGELFDICVNVSDLCYAIYGRKEKKYEREKIKSCFHSLMEKGYLLSINKLDNTTYVLDIANLYVNTQDANDGERDYYVYLTKDEFHKIMNGPEHVDKFKLLRLFLVCVNSLHKGNKISAKYKGLIGFMPQQYLAELSKISIHSVHKYNEILEGLNLLYIVRHCIHSCDSSLVKYTNTYSRYEDKELCDEFAKDEKGHPYSPEYYREKIKNQSSAMKYQYFKKGREYSKKDIKEINDYIDVHNQRVVDCVKDGELLDKVSTPKARAEAEDSDIIYDDEYYDKLFGSIYSIDNVDEKRTENSTKKKMKRNRPIDEIMIDMFDQM